MRPIGKIRYITIHAAATPPSMDIGADEIREWHLNRGWSDIGYHLVIRRDGTAELGRSTALQGAHVGGYNPGNLGVCMVGGVMEGTKLPQNNFTDAQWVQLYEKVGVWHDFHPRAIIMGHNGFPGHETRGCPCFDWRKWRDEFFKRRHETSVQWPGHWYDEIDWDEVMDE